MAGTDTRLLLLGAIALFQPVNAYQIRRELLSWDVQEWAHIQPGSIYSGLATLTKHGDVVRHDLDDRDRSVAVYEITEAGRRRMLELAREAVISPDPVEQTALHAAVGMFPLLDRGSVAEWLRIRTERLTALIERTRSGLATTGPQRPPEHAMRSLDLRRQLLEVERSWVESMLAEVESGGLWFADETSTWYPSDDDPGWQMNDDRIRYRAALAELADRAERSADFDATGASPLTTTMTSTGSGTGSGATTNTARRTAGTRSSATDGTTE